MLHRFAPAALLCLAAWLAIPAGAAETPRTIEVSGTSAMRVAPDLVVWTLTAVDTNLNLSEAKASNDRKLERLFEMIRQLGVEPEDIQTSRLSIRRVTGEKNKFLHYELRRTTTVRQKDLERFDEFFDQLVTATDEVNFNFDHTKRTELRWQARLAATEVARKKAAEVVEALGMNLGRPLTIREETQQPAWGRSFSPLANQIVHAPPSAGGEADQVEGTFAAGSIEITESLQITFELE